MNKKELNTSVLNITNNCYIMLNVCNNRYNIFIVYNNKVITGLSTCSVQLAKNYILQKKKTYKNLK